jgi:hypothetical protein
MPDRKFQRGLSILTFLAVHLLVRGFPPAMAAPTSRPAEIWSKSPPDKWPQLVLTNEANFKDHTALEGASSFLVRMPDGTVLVGTAKHLIKEAGGVNPPIPIGQLDDVLQSWRVFPRTKPTVFVNAKGRAVTVNREASSDWLLLNLVNPNAALPSTPLTPRLKAAVVGETVYLVGVPYSDEKSAQNVYKGVVTARPGKNYFTYDFDPPVHIPGFSGAPIIDENGLLVGHGVSMSPTLKQKDGLEIEFGGEDAALAVQVWKHRNDPPATQPADAVKLDLPDGWVPKVSKSARVLKVAAIPSLGAYFELFAYSKSEFDDDEDLAAWAGTFKSNFVNTTSLTNHQETDLSAGNIGGRNTLEFNATGTVLGIPLRYRIISFELNGCFCRVVCWSTLPHWDEAQPKFEEVVKAIK